MLLLMLYINKNVMDNTLALLFISKIKCLKRRTTNQYDVYIMGYSCATILKVNSLRTFYNIKDAENKQL